jgi:hypothetical protein
MADDVAAARAQGERDAQHWQDYSQDHPAGVPAGTVGEHVNDPVPLPLDAPLPLPDDPAVTGVPGGAR